MGPMVGRAVTVLIEPSNAAHKVRQAYSSQILYLSMPTKIQIQNTTKIQIQNTTKITTNTEMAAHKIVLSTSLKTKPGNLGKIILPPSSLKTKQPIQNT